MQSLTSLYDDFTFKTYINLLHSMLSRTQGAMFKVKLLFAKNYLLLLHITLWLVHLNILRFFVFKVQLSEKVIKTRTWHCSDDWGLRGIPNFY